MICEEMRVPGLPGEEDVTDGSVDWYEMDWVNVDNDILEEEMPRCAAGQQVTCPENDPTQTDDPMYQIVSE